MTYIMAVLNDYWKENIFDVILNWDKDKMVTELKKKNQINFSMPKAKQLIIVGADSGLNRR